MKNIKIYSLNDPNTGEVRYIGKTVQKLKIRRNAHIRQSKNKRTHKDWWIISLINIGLIPDFELIEENIKDEDWQEKEKFYIKKFNENKRLTNSTEGGDGATKRVFKEETRQKLRAANLGKRHTAETCKKMSESKKGIKFSEEHARKIGDAQRGKFVSDETRKKQSIVQKGHSTSDSARKKLSEFHKGKPRTEETKEKMRVAAVNRKRTIDGKFTYKKPGNTTPGSE